MDYLPRLPWFFRALLFIAAAALASAASADILVVSQNALHLGYNSKAVTNYKDGKNRFVREAATWPGSILPHLTFLQEVMAPANEADVQPPGGIVHFGAFKGSGAYFERYGVILVNDAPGHLAILCHANTAGLLSPGVNIDRPPDATLVRDSGGASPQLIWFVSFHATFNGGMGARRAEVAEIGQIIARLGSGVPPGCPATTTNVVALGDWNLDADDQAFTDLTRNAGFSSPRISPNDLTSINNQTGRLSNAYDHFVWDDSRLQVTLASLPPRPYCSTSARVTGGVIVTTNVSTFLKHCSDHLGVMAVVRVR